MNVIFLDIDGVLNSEAWVHHQYQTSRLEKHALDPAAVINLNAIVAASDAQIVVSSTWRLLHSLAWLRAHMTASGLKAEIVGYTPKGLKKNRASMKRGWEIQRWLTVEGARIGVQHMVILDDNGGMEHLAPWWIQTTFARGLCTEHVDPAIAVLKQKLPQRKPHPSGNFRWFEPTPNDQGQWVTETPR